MSRSQFAVREANDFDLTLPEDPPSARTPAQEAESLIRDYTQLREDIHHGLGTQQAQQRAHQLEQRAQVAGQVGPELNRRVNQARVDFNQFWHARPEAHAPIEERPLSALGGHRARTRHSASAQRHQLRGRMRVAVAAMRRTPDFPQAVLQSLTRGMRPQEVAAFAAHTTPSQVRALARDAGASDDEANRIVENLQTNASTAFHTLVQGQAIHRLDLAERALGRLHRPAEVRQLARQMLRGHMREGRALARQMLGGESRERVLGLLERFDTTADPALRREIEGELRSALGEGVAQAMQSVRHLREEIRSGALSDATDTQLYELAPGAVARAARQSQLAPTRGRSMTHGENTGTSLLEAGVARHARQVQDDAHLREVTASFAGWALTLAAGAVTGGAGAALVAGVLRGAIRGGVRYGADSAALEQAEAARAAGLVGQGEVERRQARRSVHAAASAAEIAVEAAIGGVKMASNPRPVWDADPSIDVELFEPGVVHGGGAHLLEHAAVELLEPLAAVGAEHAVEHLGRAADHEEGARGLEPAAAH